MRPSQTMQSIEFVFSLSRLFVMHEGFLIIAFCNTIHILLLVSFPQIVVYRTGRAIILTFGYQRFRAQQCLQPSRLIGTQGFTLVIIRHDRMGIFQMPRIIAHDDVYQRVGRKRQSGLVGCLYAEQTIESPVRPTEPSRVGNLAQCPDGTVRTRVHHGFGPRENSFHPVVEFPAGSQKAGQSQYKHEDSISSHIILPINLLFPGL